MTIKEICETYNLSQTALAKRFGIPLRTVQNWAGGQRPAPTYVVNMMIEILDHDAELDATTSTDMLTNGELADLFGYCARLSKMVSPRDAMRYFHFTFDGAVTDTFYGLAMLYAGEGVARSAADFKRDELYGPTLQQMLDDIRNILDGRVKLD